MQGPRAGDSSPSSRGTPKVLFGPSGEAEAKALKEAKDGSKEALSDGKENGEAGDEGKASANKVSSVI